MYEMTSKPLVRRTLATLRSAELGFLGVVVYTRVHTPRRCGEFCIAGDLLLVASTLRPRRTSWLMVGMAETVPVGVRAWVQRHNAERSRKTRRGGLCAVSSRSAKSAQAGFCRKAADYMPLTEHLTRRDMPRAVIDTNA